MRIHRLQGIAAYSHLIETDEALFLIDAGMVGHGKTVLAKIASLGRSPNELRLAVVTHGHADHFGGLPEIQDVAGPFDVVAHPEHARIVATGAMIASPGLNPYSRVYERLAMTWLPRMGLRGAGTVLGLDDGARLDEYGLPGRVVYTPGHSDGDLTVILDDGSAFVGDTVQGRRIPGVTPPELPNMALDVEQVLDSWQLLLDEGATTIYPAHGSVVTSDELRPVLDRLRRRSAATTGAV